jgi:hypothetical protein
MIATDVDICIVSETHLKPDIPDSVVAISNYVYYIEEIETALVMIKERAEG